MKKTFIYPLLLSLGALAQKSAMAPPINSILYNETSPVLNGKGNTILYRSESSQEPAPYWNVAYGSNNSWSTPINIDALNYSNKTIKNISPSLNFEGDMIFFSSNRFGGIGQGDLWSVSKISGKWADKATNLGMPINSKDYETDPFLAPDNKTLFFVRYNGNKTSDGLDCGDIYSSKLIGKTWSKPTKLNATINTGFEASPIMLNDNKTLVFASQRTGGKGSFDMYSTTLNDDNNWSTPTPLTFYNTQGDDRGVSLPGQANYLYFSSMGKSSTDIFKAIVPVEYQAIKTYIIKPKVQSGSDASSINCILNVKNITNNSTKSYKLAKDEENMIFLSTGSEYELVYTDPTQTLLHYTEYLNLKTLNKFEYKFPQITLPEGFEKMILSFKDFFVKDKAVNSKYIEELQRIDKECDLKGFNALMVLDTLDPQFKDITKTNAIKTDLESKIKNLKLDIGSTLPPNSSTADTMPIVIKDMVLKFGKK